MATTERPKSRLLDGRVNPEYTAWRKAQRGILDEVIHTHNTETGKPMTVHVTSFIPSDEPPNETPAEGTLVEDVLATFQSAAEPEQTTNDDPREPEVAPALEASSPTVSPPEGAVFLESSPTIEITVDRVARNKSFVYGALNGELVPIRVKKKTGPKLVGKPIPVSVSFEAGHTLYTHAP